MREPLLRHVRMSRLRERVSFHEKMGDTEDDRRRVILLYFRNLQLDNMRDTVAELVFAGEQALAWARDDKDYDMMLEAVEKGRKCLR